MGAEPWSCFTKHDANIQRALDRLRDQEFQAGRFRYAEENPSSIDEALEIADADGTASILDISQISAQPDFGCAAPFTPAELKQYFGGERPSRADVERADDYWEDMERGQARYAVVYADGQPSEIYFAGYSFD
ncbi:MAG: hypothetical protein L0228_00495 [Planctomycetes bacterium]|nr:hypothetical protein [Planctomycetota bacterium]